MSEDGIFAILYNSIVEFIEKIKDKLKDLKGSDKDE